MKQQSKRHLLALLVAALVVLGGLAALPHSAYAGINPPGGRTRYSIEGTSSVPDLGDLTIVPHGINPPTRS